ncbi:YhfT family protein [Enterococcus sp. DIV0086]|uniref:YhfT family protein n=1 Tax=Enterococcus sp. DIV0086 TaxID=2774655 RepID=UPI003D26B344
MEINILVMAVLCAVTTIMANTKIAVFNDALRPIILEYREHRVTKSALGTTALAFGIGYIVGFIPQSIATSVIIIHVVLLGTDIIGSYLPDNKKSSIWIAGVVGGLYGVVMGAGLGTIQKGFEILPYNFLSSLGQVSSVVLVAFAVFPALVVALQYGWKKGSITFMATVLAQIITTQFGSFRLSNENTIVINANAIALLVGMIFMISYAMNDKKERTDSQEQLANIFADRVKKIKKYWYLFALSGALIALAASLTIVTESALSAPLYQKGQFNSAALTELARVVGFIPLVVTTGIATGTYSPAGIKMVFVIGSLGAAIGQPILAFVVGGIWMSIEVLLLTKFSVFLDRFPGMRDAGDNIRTAITKVLEIALLVGGVIAATAIAPAWGGLFVVGLYVLNGTFKKKMVNLAIGPIGALLVGVISNILVLLNLMTPPGM